jgi:UDP-N-acetylglucosamine transferase subunit ALG13
MITVFVTVGTFKFDLLIKSLDYLKIDGVNFFFQIGSGDYIPINNPYVRYTNEYNKLVNNYDFFITHAGAGNIYHLLELNKRILIFPNLNRVDNHQLDIANYVEKNNLGIIEKNIHNLQDSLMRLLNFQAKKYVKKDFFKTKEIFQYIYS